MAGMRIGFDDDTVVSTSAVRGPGEADPYEGLRAVALDQDEALLLIDASGLCYRAYHTRDKLEAPDGSPTATLHGVLQMIRSLCSAANTRRWLLVWDGSVSVKRKLHPRYKSRHDRKRTPEEQAAHDDMRAQQRLAFSVLKDLGAPMLFDRDCEADDLISVVADRIGHLIERNHGQRLARPLTGSIVVSDDKDMLQTLSKTNRVWRSIVGKLVDEAAFQSEYGFAPTLYDSYKALVGEPATGDDIPGVTGIGDVNAAKMVGAHGELEALITVAGQLVKSTKCPKVYANLYREREQARLSRILSKTATLVTTLQSQWGVPGDRVSAAMQKAIKQAVNTNRPTPKAVVDKLRGSLGFVRSFDVRLWESVCGFEVQKGISDGTTGRSSVGSEPSEAGAGRGPIGNQPGRPVSRDRASRIDRSDGTSVVGNDGADDPESRGSSASKALMQAMRAIDGVVSNTFGPLSKPRQFSITCPVCGCELKVSYAGPRAIRAACVTRDCLTFMS